MLNKIVRSTRIMPTLAALGLISVLSAIEPANAASTATFPMLRSKGLPAACAPKAKAIIELQGLGFAEKMTVKVSGLPAGTELDLFALQLPNAPFGIGWYVGDLKTDAAGNVTKTFVGRFSIETFAVAVGKAPAPKVDASDAAENPAFKPVHTLHLGMWFNSPGAAKKAGCPIATTPFNGTHNAGIQVLSTNQFANNNGPLNKIR